MTDRPTSPGGYQPLATNATPPQTVPRQPSSVQAAVITGQRQPEGSTAIYFQPIAPGSYRVVVPATAPDPARDILLRLEEAIGLADSGRQSEPWRLVREVQAEARELLGVGRGEK